MKNRSSKRTLLLLVAPSLFLVVFGLGYGYLAKRRTASQGTFERIEVPRDIKLGDFTLSPIEEWSEDFFKSDSLEYVRYSNKEGVRGLERKRIQLNWYPVESTNTPKNQHDLETSMKKALEMRLSWEKGTSISTKIVSSQHLKFAGMEAFKILYTTQVARSTTYGTTIAFLNKGHYYNLATEINVDDKHSSLLPQWRSTTDQALAALSKQLTLSA